MFGAGPYKRAIERDVDIGRRGKIASVTKRSNKFVDDVLRCRFEMKYLISEAVAAEIKRFIGPYLSLDRYSKLQPGGAYPIVSLYLDSKNFRLCRESLTGQKNRFKLRVRNYSDDEDYPSFFEIKRRINSVILKSRAAVRQQDVANLLSGLSLPPQAYKTDVEALDQFQLYTSSIGAQPKILIRYLRQAYESDSQNRVRITFDRELCYKVTTAPEVKLDGTSWQRNSLTVGNVILEIKFTARYPAWLGRMVKCFNLRQRSISKYATSLKQSCVRGFCAPRI
jgi:hypothetical protein